MILHKWGIYLIAMFFLNFNISQVCAQKIDWAIETGLNAGDTFVDGQIIANFANSGLNVRINVNVVNGSPKIHPTQSTTRVSISDADGASFSLTILNGSSDIVLNNTQNTLDGEQITIANLDSENIVIEELSNNGGGAMTVDGINMPTGGLSNKIVGDDSVTINEQNAGAGTMWTASMEDITSFSWTYEAVGANRSQEGFELTLSNTTFLPVELVDFEISYSSNDAVWLEWKTASELNNDYFTIEKSKNANDWIEIAMLRGHGTTMKEHKYLFVDEEPFGGLSYYRLKQTDFDGTSTYFKVKSISLLKKNKIKLSPNPTTDFVKVDYLLGDFRIVDVVGKVVNNLISVQAQDKTSLTLNLTKLRPGVYFFISHNDSYKMIKK